MRYFLISFSLQSIASCGNIALECEIFPSKNYIAQAVQRCMALPGENNNLPDKHKLADVIVLNIFEFKNEEDYKDFCDE
jgi:hypothetical protein